MPERPSARDETSPEDLTPEFWGAKYRVADWGWDLGQVSPPFVKVWESGLLKPGRMLIPGCGRGWEALYFAEKGFKVTALDFAPEALIEVERRANEAGLEIDECRQDFLNLSPELIGCFDVILEQTCFCAIHPTQRPRYVAAAKSCLKPGGELIGLFYSTRERGGPPFDTDPEDVRRLFEPFFELEHFALTPNSHPRRLGQEWLGMFRKKSRH